MCIEKFKRYLNPMIMSAMLILILSLLGVPVIATIAILAGLFAYSKGYRININKQERQ
jgi:hypothetical protein